MQQEQENIRKAANGGLTTREHNEPFQEIMVVIRDSLSDVASSDCEEDGEDGDHPDIVLGKLSEEEEPGLVVLATVMDCHFRPGSGSNLNRCPNGGSGCQ